MASVCFTSILCPSSSRYYNATSSSIIYNVLTYRNEFRAVTRKTNIGVDLKISCVNT